MKLPNGYGSIHKLSGNRRNPYRVRITTGFSYDEEKQKTVQQYRTIGYFPSYEEANKALTAYHNNPLCLDPDVTFAEVFRRWSDEKFQTSSASLITSYTAAYRAVPMLYDLEFRKIRRNHLQNAIDTCGKRYPTLLNVKLIISLMYRYAIQNDLVEKDYSSYIDVTKHKPKAQDAPDPIHTDIKPDEIDALWKNRTHDGVPETLMLIYSGLRVGEFFQLTQDDINLSARIVTIKKSKTASGLRRVPIAAKTLTLWQDYFRTLPSNSISESDVRRRSNAYRYKLSELCPALKIADHLPHDTRHTCATLLFETKVDSYIVKKILGHAEQDITDKVYTHLSDALLIEAIDKI